MKEKNDKDHIPSPTPLANQPHNMSPIEAQSNLNIINHDNETDSESEVSNSHQSENSFFHRCHNYHHLHYNYKYHHHHNYHHHNHNFKYHHYHNHHYRQKHLHQNHP